MTALTMSAAQAAAALDVSEDWLRRNANAGVVPHIRMGRRLRFTQQNLDDYIASCLQRAADPLSQSAASRNRKRRTDRKSA